MNSPQLVAGPWIEPNGLTSMDIDQDIIDEFAVQPEVVRNIFCGGDQSFALVTSDMVELIWIQPEICKNSEL